MTAPYVPETSRPADLTPAPAVPPKNSRRGIIVVSALVGLLLLGGLAIGLTVALSGDDDRPAVASSAGNSDPQTFVPPTNVTTPPTADPTPTSGPTPVVADFKLTPKIIDKQCFGSAGCNITLRIQLGYSGLTLSESDTWLVTYEINGIEDAPAIGTLRLTGTTFESSEENVSTTSSKKKVTLTVTDVEKEGI